MNISAESGGKRRWQHPQRRHGGGQEQRTKTLDGSGEYCLVQRQALLSHPVDIGDHDDAVLRGHAEQGDEADGARDVERLSSELPCDQAAQARQRYHAEDEQRLMSIGTLFDRPNQPRNFRLSPPVLPPGQDMLPLTRMEAYE